MNITTHLTSPAKAHSKNNQSQDPVLLHTGSLSPLIRDSLYRIANKRVFKSGDTLFWEGDRLNYYFFINKGTIKRYKMLPNGRSQIIGFMIEGDCLVFPEREKFTCTAEALTALEVTAFPQPEFDKLLDIDPALRQIAFQALNQELRQSQKQALLLGRMPAVERVGQFLWDFFDYAHPDYNEKDGCKMIDLPMTRSDIADYLGLTIETVSRVFSKFKKDHVIELPKPNKVLILKPDLFAKKKG